MLEVTISTVLVSVLLTVSMTTAGTLVWRHGMRAQDDIKMALAHDLLCELNQVFFADPASNQTVLGPEFGEANGNRQRFDDIDDYDGWVEVGIHDRAGELINDFGGYQRSVQVVYARLSDPSITSSSPTDLKRIVIQVTGPDNESATLTSLRSRRGSLDLIPGVQSTYVRGVQINVTGDHASHPVRSGSGLLNQVNVGNP